MVIIYNFDCGTINLGVCVFVVRRETLSSIKNILTDVNNMTNDIIKSTDDSTSTSSISITKRLNEILEALDQINLLLKQFITVVHIDLVTAKTASSLKNYLTKLDTYIATILNCYLNKTVNKLNNLKRPIILIERQFLPGSQSRVVSNYLEYHYANYDTFASYNTNWSSSIGYYYDVLLVGATLKNAIDYDKMKTYGYFISKYKTNYTANKCHSVAQFEYLCDKFDHGNMLKTYRSKKNRDIADAYMMGINWILRKVNSRHLI